MRAVFLVALLLVILPARGAIFVVVSSADDGSAGTLRWAIDQANAAPGFHEIRFDPSVTTIILRTSLPTITGRVWMAGSRRGEVTIDARAIPNDGLTVRADLGLIAKFRVINAGRHGFSISGARLEHCRASDNGDAGFHLINAGLYDSVSTGNRRGIVIEGRSWLESNHVGVAPDMREPAGNRETGIHLTASASNTQIGHQACFGGGFHCLPGVFNGNTVAGNGGHGILVEGNHNRLEGNVVGGWSEANIGNGGDGIRITGQGNSLDQANTVSYNAGAGVRMVTPTVVDDIRGGCNGGPLLDAGPPGFTANDALEMDGVQNAPEIHRVVSDATVMTTEGALRSLPNQSYAIDLYGIQGDCGVDRRISWLTRFAVRTDARGEASFRKTHLRFGRSIAATATVLRSESLWADKGGTSELSSAVLAPFNPANLADFEVVVTPSTISAARGDVVTFTIIVKNSGPAAVFEVRLSVNSPRGTSVQRWETRDDRVDCTTNGCRLTYFAAGETRTIRQRVRIDDGVPAVVYRAALSPVTATPDPHPANNAAVATVTVVSPRYRTTRR